MIVYFKTAVDRKGFARSHGWILVIGYILSRAVYSLTFGHYVAHSLSLGAEVTRILSLAVLTFLTLIIFRGVGDSSGIEVFIAPHSISNLIIIVSY